MCKSTYPTTRQNETLCKTKLIEYRYFRILQLNGSFYAINCPVILELKATQIFSELNITTILVLNKKFNFIKMEYVKLNLLFALDNNS